MAKPGSNFGLVSGIIGLTLCFAQTIKGHHDAVSERERLQEAHEQKMHFLHEFHRQQLQAKEHEMQAREHRIGAREMERRAREAERRAERMVGRVLEGRLGMGGDVKDAVVGGGKGLGIAKESEGWSSAAVRGGGREDKERELWRLLESAREEQDGDARGREDGAGIVHGMEEKRHQ